jgi:hypothetical protein
MKKLILLPLLATLAVPAFADSTKTTTTRTYEESVPMMQDSDMIEAEEESFDDSTLDQESLDQERMEDQDQWEEQEMLEEQEMMEERSEYEAEEAIDYDDRTRTDRARKAMDTSSDASDDE